MVYRRAASQAECGQAEEKRATIPASISLISQPVYQPLMADGRNHSDFGQRRLFIALLGFRITFLSISVLCHVSASLPSWLLGKFALLAEQICCFLSIQHSF